MANVVIRFRRNRLPIITSEVPSGLTLTLVGASATTTAGSFTLTVQDTITGASATTSPGSFTPTVQDTITGASAATNVGSFTPTIAKTLTGASANTSPGSFTPTATDTLTGASASTNVGSFTPTIAKTLTGVSATLSAGSLSPTLSKSLTGVSITTSTGSFTPVINKTLVGASATASAGTIATSTGGSDVTLTLTGVSATASAGSFALTILKTLAGVSATTAAGLLSRSISKTLVGVSTTASAGSIASVISKALAGALATTAVGTFAVTRAYSVSRAESTIAVTFTPVGIATSLTETGNASSSTTFVIEVTAAEHGSAVFTTTVNIGAAVRSSTILTKDGISAAFDYVASSAESHLSSSTAIGAPTFNRTVTETTTARSANTETLGYAVTRNETGSATSLPAETWRTNASRAEGSNSTSSTQTVLVSYRLSRAEQTALAKSVQAALGDERHEIGNAAFSTTVNVATAQKETTTSVVIQTFTYTYGVTATEIGAATDVNSAIGSLNFVLAEVRSAVESQNFVDHIPTNYSYFFDEDIFPSDLVNRSARARATIRAKNTAYNPVPTNMPTWQPWLQLVSRAANSAIAGKTNVTQNVTLTPAAATTTIFDTRIGSASGIQLIPMSASAAAENPWLSDQINGQVTINHIDSTTADRLYRVVILA